MSLRHPDVGADIEPAEPEILVAMWRLEGASKRLFALATSAGVEVTVAARALEVRADLGGHLLAARVLLSSGASTESVLAVLRRAAAIASAAGV